MRKSSVLDVSNKDVTRMLATCPQQVVYVVLVELGERHDTRTNGQHYTPQMTAADQSGKRVASWTGKLPDTPDILVASSRGCRSCRACRRGCHEDATRKLLPWNLSCRSWLAIKVALYYYWPTTWHTAARYMRSVVPVSLCVCLYFPSLSLAPTDL